MGGCVMHESITYGCSACNKMGRAADALEARLSAIQQMVDDHTREIAEWKRRAYKAEDDASQAECERLRTVIRTGGAMYRAERAAMGIPGGGDGDGDGDG